MEHVSLAKRVFLRFARVFVGGFISALLLQLQQGGSLNDLETFLNSLLFAGLVGGLMAVDKVLRG